MSIVNTVSPEQATGTVASVYEQVRGIMGRVPNTLQLVSSSPAILQTHAAQMGYYMQHPTLSLPLQAFIRLSVSTRMDCAYCMGMNEGMLINRDGFSPEQVAAAKTDPKLAPLPENELAMLQFVTKATAEPKSIQETDIDQLRELGWTDGDIVDALFHGARNVSVDIMFDALKIEKDY